MAPALLQELVLQRLAVARRGDDAFARHAGIARSRCRNSAARAPAQVRADVRSAARRDRGRLAGPAAAVRSRLSLLFHRACGAPAREDRCCPRRTRPSNRSSRCTALRNSWNASATTCTASCSAATPTCARCCYTRDSSDIRCARTTRRIASSRWWTTGRRASRVDMLLPNPVRPAFDRRDCDDAVIVNIGPSHPATHGTIQVIAALDGEKVARVDVHCGYLHRGFEKECESHTWHNLIPYVDRLNYCSGAHQRLRLLRRGRNADGDRDHAALPLPAHAAVRVLAHRRSPDVHRGLADGDRRHDGVPLSRDDPRLHLRAPRPP